MTCHLTLFFFIITYIQEFVYLHEAIYTQISAHRILNFVQNYFLIMNNDIVYKLLVIFTYFQ